MIITRGLEEKFGYPLSKHTRQGYKQLKTKQICYTILMCMFICGWNCTYISGVVEVRHAVAQHVTRQSRVKVKATPRQDYVGIQEMWGRGFISNPFATSALAVRGAARRPCCFSPGKDPVSFLQEAGWASGPFSTGTGQMTGCWEHGNEHPYSENIWKFLVSCGRAVFRGVGS